MNRPKTCPLPSEVKSRINRIAHAMAAEHEAATRQRLLDGIQCLAAAGASLQAMHCHLDAVEGQGAVRKSVDPDSRKPDSSSRAKNIPV